MHPASTAQTIRCGAWRTSALRCAVPRMNAGTLQRARNTPNTITKETVMGEISELTSLIGASAPPSQAPAANPQYIPRACSERKRDTGSTLAATGCVLSIEVLNGACPAGRFPPAILRAGSRGEDRWRWRQNVHPELSCRRTRSHLQGGMLPHEGPNLRELCSGSQCRKALRHS